MAIGLRIAVDAVRRGWTVCLIAPPPKIVASVLTLNWAVRGDFLRRRCSRGFVGAGMAPYWTADPSALDGNFVAAGMCGVFVSAFHAPLTGYFSVTGMSGSYLLMVPLFWSVRCPSFCTGTGKSSIHSGRRSPRAINRHTITGSSGFTFFSGIGCFLRCEVLCYLI